MESKDLLHPENDENQIHEVNSGASDEVQTNVESNEPVTAENSTVESENNTEKTVTEELVTDMEHSAEESNTETTPEPEVTTEEPVAEPENVNTVAETSTEESLNSSVNDMITEIESTQHPDEHEDESEHEENEEDIEESLESIEEEYADLTLENAIAELTTVVALQNYAKTKQRVGILKSKILEHIKILKQKQLEAFLNDGGIKEEFQAEKTDLEDTFEKALLSFKETKIKFIENLEIEKQRNLEAKNEIIESLKNLIENEVNLKILNDKFKEYQEKWKEIGPVPQNESTNLWQNYHFYVEKFFDILRINKELRHLDLKKNLEQKIKLCEQAESLLLQDSVNKSFKALQELHNEWKEIGPVPDNQKEEIWERFKNASDQINQRRKEYYEKLYTEQQNNYNAKIVLCEQAEELVARETTSVKEANEISEKLAELLKVWKTLGPAPPKYNDEIWIRFKSNLDKFFDAKKEQFHQLKELHMQNYNLKLNLAIQAEAIALRTDWRKATDELLELQKEWKNIGATPRKYSEAIWKRFRAACDTFFNAKSNYYTNIQDIEAENLKKKEELIQKVIAHEFGDNRTENMDAMKMYQREWTEIGHVPKKDKDRVYNEFRDAVNKRFSDLKISMDEVRSQGFKNKIETILNNPDAERILDKEKRFLQNKISQLKEDIILWENNLGFFANSKNADLLKQEFSKKIDAAKAEVKDLESKVRLMGKAKKD